MSTQSPQEHCAVQIPFPRPLATSLTLQPVSVKNSETSAYHYEDLPDGCIRLLELLPGNGHHPIRCQLFQVALSEERPYEAISYVWGDPTYTVEIECEDQQLAIGLNLRGAFLRLRSTTKVRILWADAICIHQANLVEKMQQVKLMGLIYYKATRVLAWLGFGDKNEESGTDVALHTMKNIQVIFPPLPSSVGSVDFRTHSSDEVAGSRSNQNRWEAIYQFFELPWFKRVWVVQEAGLAIDLLYHCGDSTISRSELHAFIDWLTGPGDAARRYFEIDLRQHYMAQNYIAHVRHSKPCDTFTFLEILEGGSGLACTDPRDAIYAFLGYPSAFIPGPSQLRGTVIPYPSSLSSAKTMIDPDYTKDLATLYYDTAAVLLRNADLGPGLLLYVGHDEESLESTCPSWIPQWHVPEVHLFFTGHSTRAASGDLKHSTFYAINNRDLILKAIPLDRVHFTWVFAGQGSFAILNNVYVYRDNTVLEKDLSPVEYLWREFSVMRSTLPNPSYSDVYAFRVTLTAGMTGDSASTGSIAHATAVTTENLDQHYANFCAYRLQKAAIWGPELSKKYQRESRAEPRNADQYIQDVQWSSANRAFFCTDQGHIGLGPWIMEAGDECWLPLGSTVPFVLRPVAEGRYNVLGQAYINGMTEGEAVEGLGEGDFEEIVLC